MRFEDKLSRTNHLEKGTKKNINCKGHLSQSRKFFRVFSIHSFQFIHSSIHSFNDKTQVREGNK